MNYLLDTCVLSELRRPNANPGVVEWVERTAESRLYLSVVAFSEVQKGITKLEDTYKKRSLQLWLEQDLIARFAGRILGVNTDIALVWGSLLGEGEREGRPVAVVDALIAATALAHNLTVVTRNADDFERFPVRVLNPWE